MFGNEHIHQIKENLADMEKDLDRWCDESSFKCSLLNKNFSLRYNSNVHEQKKKYTCELCVDIFCANATGVFEHECRHPGHRP